MSSGEKQTQVGRFFEEIGHQLLGGKLARNSEGDICLWKIGTTVEVKSSGYESSYGFRLDIEQIEHYEKLREFPFSRAWYMLFAYRNRHLVVDGRRVMEFAPHASLSDVHRYLVDSVLWCVVLDLSIINRWKESLPHSTKSILGHLGTKTIDLKCRDVSVFVGGESDKALEKLGLDPKLYSKLSGETTVVATSSQLAGVRLKFPTVAILPVSDACSLRRVLARRGFRLSTTNCRR